MANYKDIVSKYVDYYNERFSKNLIVRPEVNNFDLIRLNFDFECLDALIKYFDSKSDKIWESEFKKKIYSILEDNYNKYNLFKSHKTAGYSSDNKDIDSEKIPSILNYL
jgi:hypothetical protein